MDKESSTLMKRMFHGSVKSLSVPFTWICDGSGSIGEGIGIANVVLRDGSLEMTRCGSIRGVWNKFKAFKKFNYIRTSGDGNWVLNANGRIQVMVWEGKIRKTVSNWRSSSD